MFTTNSKIEVWEVSYKDSKYYTRDKEDAIEMTRNLEGGASLVKKIEMTEEAFEALPEFEGF